MTGVPCWDAMDRPAEITVTVRDGRAVLKAPPGETAQLTSRELVALIERLQTARNELFAAEIDPPTGRRRP